MSNSADCYHSPFFGTEYVNFINAKNRGGRFLPSKQVFQIVHESKKESNSTKIPSMKNLEALMVFFIRQQLSERPFPLCDHDLEHDILTEGLHSSQLASRIIS